MSIRPSRPVAPAVWAIVLLAAGAYAQQAEQFDEYAAVSPSVPEGRSGPSARVGNIELELNLTSLRHHAGEAAVGASAGVLGAWVAHRLQSTALLLSVLGGLGTAAALHLKWVSSDQVHAATRCALLFYFSAAGCALALALIRLIQTPTRIVRPIACAGAPARLWHLPAAAAEVGLAHATGGPRWRRQCVNGIFQPTLARARNCVVPARCACSHPARSRRPRAHAPSTLLASHPASCQSGRLAHRILKNRALCETAHGADRRRGGRIRRRLQWATVRRSRSGRAGACTDKAETMMTACRGPVEVLVFEPPRRPCRSHSE